MSVMIPVSWGELVDRITILEIKERNITDSKKARHVREQLSRLRSVHRDKLSSRFNGGPTDELEDLTGELSETNSRIWSAENEMRRCEKRLEFGDAFLNAALAVRRDNDHRVALKARIDELLGSDFSEVKQFIQD